MDCSAVRKILFTIGLAIALASASQAANGDFQKGELLSVTSGKGLDNDATHHWAIFTVQVADVIFTGSGKRIHHQSDDYSEGLNPGDTVYIAINGSEMILRKPNGGELKTKIIKRAHAQLP
jgi:hypothetical protein